MADLHYSACIIMQMRKAVPVTPKVNPRARELVLTARPPGGRSGAERIATDGALAFAAPIIELLPRTGGRSADFDRVLDLLLHTPPSELPALADLIEGRAVSSRAADRARRIALVGLRGAGKSTLGARLAQHLGCPF